MKKRCTALLLVLCLLAGMLPTTVLAAGSDNIGDLVVVSKKEYAIAPDITEYELITNNSDLSAQQAGHIMEVKLGGYADIIVGYKDYNIPTIQSGNNWGMEEPTAQAQNAETRRSVNVVGAVNGDFFNMSNGAPTGALIMNSTEIKTGTSPCFWVDSNNQAHISASGAAMKAEAEAAGVTIREAIGGNAILLQDGQRTSAGGSYGDAPNPRTVVGIKADGTVVIYMVNGRQAPYSVGMSYGELADIMLSQNCVDALNLDGGGSSVFATQREGESNDNGAAGLTVRCRPSDGYERSVSSCLLVVSKAEQTGIFDHATLSPADEVYTPGSSIQFTAQGVDAGGGPAALPDGITWSVTSGSDLGTINAATGRFTAVAGKTGTVEVSLSYNGSVVGKTTVELQWPDTLSFTNSSVSLDFGQASDLSFNPTWNGREVHYKDGDFTWTLNPTSYKYNMWVEKYNNKADLYITLTGQIGVEMSAEYSQYGTYLNYATYYVEESRKVEQDSNGTIYVKSLVKNTKAANYSGGVVTGWVSEDQLQKDREVRFPVGKFQNNQFVADKESSLKGTIQVSLAGDPSVTGSISVIVGMEPVVLMDFEGGHTDPITNQVLSAEEYWTFHVGMSEVNGGNSLSLQERKNYRVMIRDTTGKGVQWPAGQNRLMSSSEDSRVRFGSYALQLAWDFTSIDPSQVAAADFGFTSLIYAHVVQPTKIGFWINVPEDRATDTSQVKMVFVGGITGITDTTVADAAKPGLENAYWDMDAEGNLTWHPHKLPKGTTQYLNYYSYDSDGNITGSQLKDWAGKGWTWIEADLSNAQFPIGIQYGYTIRIVSPQNNEKQKGNILIDNLQLIYGTNTNDIYNPVIDSISETSSGTPIHDNSAEFASGNLSFEVTYSDNELTDKYATGIDVSGIQVSIDGHDYTAQAEISASAARFSATDLINGSHTLTVKVKDLYGNESTATRTFTVNDDAGANALVSLVRPEASPVVAGSYTLTLRNLDATPMKQASITLRLPSAYTEGWYVAAGEGYTASGKLEGNDLLLTAKRAAEGTAGDVIATVTFSIPSDAREGDTFQYTLTSGSYVTSTGSTASFSQPQVTVPLTAGCTLGVVGDALANFPAALVVKDDQGQPVAGAQVYLDNGGAPVTTGESGTLLGTTGKDGTLSHTFTSAGRSTLYAKTDAGRSWNTAVVVNTVSTEGPFAVQSVASADGATQRTVTWLSPIGASLEGTAQMRVIPTGGNWADAQIFTGETEIVAFTETNSGTALRLNTVKVDRLTPNTTYSYQVGDGSSWLDTVHTFTTASDDPEGATNFFIFGDIQTDSTANLAAAIEKVKASGINYAFGLQTGDAIDNPTAFSNWRSYLTVLNAQTLGAIDVVHTLGNHEFYGDADGSNAGSIFALPTYAGGSFYSVEYGSVYVAVVNNGGDFKAALENVKVDAADSDCIWKVLVVHEPIYGTVEELDAETRKELTAIIEGAGIDFVFTGDDHAYARTVPLKGDAETTAEEGVVYYVCGDLSGKDNEYHGDRSYFAKAIPHSEYSGMYLSVQADGTQITITAYDYQGNLLDSYTKTKEKSPCDLGEHTYNGDSLYDLSAGTVSCALCGETVSAAESGYTGLLNTTGGEGRVLLVQGVLQKDGWFTWGEEMCHVAANGLIHSIVPLVDTATCLTNGQLKATCTECGDVYRGQATWAKGHTWDESYVCTVCGTQGTDIANATLTVQYAYYSYTGNAIRPYSEATYNGTKLVASSDRYGTDAYISYENNLNIGVGTVTYEGRGNFYGSISKSFTIVPASVSTIQADRVDTNSVTLSWSAAKGAQTYMIQQQQSDGSWVRVGSTSGTSFTVTNLSMKTDYVFRVHTMATVDGKDYYCLSYSNELKVTTPDDLTQYTETYVTHISCSLPGGIVLQPQVVDGVKRFFLPSSADLTALKLNITLADGETRTLTLSGDLSSVEGVPEPVDLTALASKAADGSYTLSVALGDLEPFEVKIMASASIAAMYLTSADPENAGRDYVDAAKGNSAEGSMTMVAADGTVVYNGALSQIKSRGNSTFLYYDKKSYQIKLDGKSDLLGLNESGKTWVLLAGYGDATQMHDKLFKDLAAQVGLAFSPDCDWVDLYYDGEYRGTYLLSEKNNVNENTVNITDMEKLYEQADPSYGDNAVTAEGTNAYGQSYSYTQGLAGPDDLTGGWLLELNHNTIDEANGFHTRQEVAFNVKSPEFGSQEAIQYISEYYQEFEDAVYATDSEGNYTGLNPDTGKYYYDYCDLDSLVRMFLVQQLSLNTDAYASSMYFYKDAGGKMYAGPIWDMEMSCGTGWGEYIASNREFLQLRYLSEALMQIPSFINAVKECYSETFGPAAETLFGGSGLIAGYADTLSASTAMNYVLWPYVRLGDPGVEGHFWAEGTTYEDVVADMTQWLEARLAILEENYGGQEPSDPGTTEPEDPGTTPEDPGTTGGGDTPTDPDKNIVSIQNPASLEVTKGTAASALSLPASVTVTLEDGTTVEVPVTWNLDTFQPDTVGSQTITGTLAAVEGVANPDNRTAQIVVVVKSTSSGGSSGGSSGNKTETVTNEDGSTTTTVTKPDGTVTETTKQPDGSKEVVETKKDGSSTTTVEQKDGSSSVTKVDTEGTVTSEVTLSDSAVSSAQEGKTYASLPIPSLPVTSDKAKAPTVTVDLPKDTAVQVEIPVENVTPGTVAILVGADGSETVIQNTRLTEKGVAVSLTDGETVKIVDNSKSFTDVAKTHWASDAVAFVVSRGLVLGTSDTTFAPELTTSRSMMVTVLWRMVGQTQGEGSLSFTDVEADSWYTEAVRWAAGSGIVTGYTAETFGPADNITREQMAAILYRYADKMGYDVTGRADLSGYADAGKVSDWTADAMAWAVDQGLITGKTGGILDPQGQATRAEIATIFMRFCENVVK